MFDRILNCSRYSRMGQLKFVEESLKLFTWSILKSLDLNTSVLGVSINQKVNLQLSNRHVPAGR